MSPTSFFRKQPDLRVYHQRLKEAPEVLQWLHSQYGITDETIENLLIGYADNIAGEESREGVMVADLQVDFRANEGYQ